MSESAEKDMILGSIETFTKSEIEFKIQYEGGESARLTILNHHVFRFYMSPTGEFQDYPTPHNAEDKAKINSKSVHDYDKDAFDKSYFKFSESSYIVHTEEIKIVFHKTNGTMTVHDKRLDKTVLKEHKPLRYSNEKTTQTLSQYKGEYFFGGGMQNGRFNHKGEIIHIENTNNWVDGGVSSPNPFYWSSRGYGVLRNTWQPGVYDFGSDNPNTVETAHDDYYFDAFYFINSRPNHILNDYYELTGQPIFMPEYAFYEAHLNAFNRDYWVEVNPNDKGAIKFEDGKFYKSYQPDQMDGKKGILESLNGEKNNYQFSARAMIDRYKKHDMPLGWFIPNDGYGSGYGQTDSLEGDIKNLKEFIQYANRHGVEVALWTESNLEPKDPKHPKKGERDLSHEVGVGTVALKCDVTWIGKGYSFGLNAVEHATKILVHRVKKQVRPLVIMVDGWAGTQRYSGIWSGDQSGGEWEYIRFHIPTYVGAGLSGLPVVGSDMDGIYGGGDREINVRDYQWKTFTPLQLNMDGWGSTPKMPFSFDQEATDINRAYLKLKSMLLPYNYTIAHESLHGLPMVRAMFLEFPNEEPAYTKDSLYQFMWGPNLLVAPVYEKSLSEENTHVRHGVYLPDQNQIWIDLFTGRKFQGGKIYNHVKTPLWKMPVFVRNGAIIPFVNENNNIHAIKKDCRIITFYPDRNTEFVVYEDDGKSAHYLQGHYSKTKITSVGPKSNTSGDLHIHIHKTEGHYENIVKKRTTLLRIMAAEKVQNVKAAINGESIKMVEVHSEHEFHKLKDNGYYYDRHFVINPYLKKFGEDKLYQKFLLIKIERADVTETEIQIKVSGFTSNDTKTKIFGRDDASDDKITAPIFATSENGITPTSINLQWVKNNASYYEIERDGVIFSNIITETFTFEGLQYNSEHAFRMRSVSDKGVSEWGDYQIIQTLQNPYRDLVKGVIVKCNLPCQPAQEVGKLTTCDKSIWHTHWKKPTQANEQIILSFDLSSVYNIKKIEYTPREDAGNGTILKIRYRHSVNGKSWGETSPIITWKRDSATKVIMIEEVSMRFFEMTVLESVGGFGSGRNVLFFKYD